MSGIHIYTESSPNPHSMKFVLDFMLLDKDKSMNFSCAQDARDTPLVEDMFAKFDYVENVFLMSNFITITKNPSKQWAEVTRPLRKFLTSYLKAKRPTFSQPTLITTTEPAVESAAVNKIRKILDEYIKPAVEMDGGAIQFHAFNEKSGVLKLLLQGACSGCPSSTITLKAGIENLMQRMVPSVKQVIAHNIERN